MVSVHVHLWMTHLRVIVIVGSTELMLELYC